MKKKEEWKKHNTETFIKRIVYLFMGSIYEQSQDNTAKEIIHRHRYYCFFRSASFDYGVLILFRKRILCDAFKDIRGTHNSRCL